MIHYFTHREENSYRVCLLYNWLWTGRTRISGVFRQLKKLSLKKFGHIWSVFFKTERDFFFFWLSVSLEKSDNCYDFFSLSPSILRKWLNGIYHLAYNVFNKCIIPESSVGILYCSADTSFSCVEKFSNIQFMSSQLTSTMDILNFCH